MKKLLILFALIVLCLLAWRMGSRLSADALGMAMGLLFGIMAGVPTALLAMAAGRHRQQETPAHGQGRGVQDPHGYYPPAQPPVIVLAGQGYPGQSAQPTHAAHGQQTQHSLLPAPASLPEERRFRVVGEEEAWVDEW